MVFFHICDEESLACCPAVHLNVKENGGTTHSFIVLVWTEGKSCDFDLSH